MENLPLVILQTICEHLAQLEFQRDSLLAFANSSTTLAAASTRERFSRVIVKTSNAECFQRDLLRLDAVLDTAGSRKYVRLLRICDKTEKNPEDQENGDPFSLFAGANIDIAWKDKLWRERYRNGTLDGISPGSDSWELFARLLSGFALKDLIWATEQQVPLCVLTTLHQKIPTCRLHVHTFDLRSLHQGEGYQNANIDDDEYALATSPCLQSIIAQYARFDEVRRANYNMEAIQQMAAGSAPNLKHVYMWYLGAQVSGEIRSPRPRVRLPWQGFYPSSNSESPDNPSTQGRLRSLKIDSGGYMGDEDFFPWERHSDFSHLRSLDLSGMVNVGFLRKLSNLAVTHTFSRLQALTLLYIDDVDDYDYGIELDEEWCRLLSSFPPMQSLIVGGVRELALAAVLTIHGASLRCLHIEDFIVSTKHIVQLHTSFASIRDLNIEVLRTGGNREEASVYRTLGALWTLEKLTLRLQCTAYRRGMDPDREMHLIWPSEEEKDIKKMRIALRQVLVNAALNEELARSIFDTLLAANTNVQMLSSPKLSYIKLEMGDASIVNGLRMSEDFLHILRWIGRQWVWKQGVVEEFGTMKRLEAGEKVQDDLADSWFGEYYADLWWELWPKERGWKENWKSFPLDCNL